MVGLHTVDFFPPVVNDAAAYGAIAAANSLSDIYAAGGTAKVVLNLAGFPEEWGDEILQPLFAAAVEKVQEAGALWVGGHSVRSAEPLFGFAIYGEVPEDELVTNSAARAGDRLFLSKPIGSGCINTGVKRNVAMQEDVDAAVAGMGQLNLGVAQAMRTAKVRAATDITGFGLLGHAANIARASKVRLQMQAERLPLYPGAARLAEEGVFSGAAARGAANLEAEVQVAAGVPEWLAKIGFDAETSGGLLLCVAEDQVNTLLEGIPDGQSVVEVGQVIDGQAGVDLQ
jgi:selenide,water dikinase